MIALRRGTGDDLIGVMSLLQSAGLPPDGLMVPPTDLVVAVDTGGVVVGAGAIEHHGDDALLRSLVVDRSIRSNGIGSAIATELERLSHEAGLGGPYLLTDDAEAFFVRRGYRRIGRDQAPAAVMASLQWSEVCDRSATAMVLG